jgi:hypothetical protein
MVAAASAIKYANARLANKRAIPRSDLLNGSDHFAGRVLAGENTDGRDETRTQVVGLVGLQAIEHSDQEVAQVRADLIDR